MRTFNKLFHPQFLQSNQFEMGSQIERVHAIDLTYYAPPLEQYRLSHSGPNYYVWDHSLQHDSLIQFPINISNDHAFKQYVDTYLFRHRHPLLVSSLYFKRNEATGKGSIFYERVFTNLARIKDIPFGDSLQFYYVALKGFQLLFRKFGYFSVEEEMFHITKANKVKIWCHKDISKEKPKHIKQESLRGSESDMVKRIIRIIQQNSDPSSTNFPVGAEIYDKASISFASAIQKLRQICCKQKFTIPDKLTCLDLISKGEVGALLDEYGSNFNAQFEPQPVENNRPLQNLDLFGIKNDNFYNKPAFVLPVQACVDQNEFNNTRSTKKRMGLQVSHSLEKLRQGNRNCSSNINFNRKNQVSYTGFPPQRIFQSPIKQLEEPTLNLVKVTGIPQPLYPQQQPGFISQPPLPHHRYFVNPQTNSQPIQVRGSFPIARSNSFDNIHLGQTPKQPQYQIVINGINRPISSMHSSAENIQFQNIPRPPVNNLLNPRLLTISPPPPHITSSHNIKPVSSQYEKKSVQNSNNQLHPMLRQNLNSYQVGLRQKQNTEIPTEMPQLKCRQTFISDLSQFEKFQPFQPLKDQTNFKTRFEQYKKSFNFDRNHSRENNTSKAQLNKGLAYKSYNPTKLQKPFFGGILNAETVNSYLDSNGRAEKQSTSEKISEKSLQNEANQFPSITDVSDNISSLPVKQKEGWREQSVVVKHEPDKMRMGVKKYEPKIDGQIWADMLKARNRMKLAGGQI